MLRSFRVGNHRSFADENELLLMSAADDRSVVPVAAVYGANASGKSNLLDGLRFMQRAVTQSFSQWEPFAGVPRSPFSFRTNHVVAVPSTYVVEIVADGIPWTYGFTVDNERVLEEWLFSYPEKRKRVLFQRTGDEYSSGSAMAENRAQLKVIQGLTRPNTLFLSAVAQAMPEMFQPVHRWFRESLILADRRRSATSVVAGRIREMLLRSSANEGVRLLELVQAADFGIASIEAPELLPDSGARALPPLVFDHYGSEGVVLPLEQESAGTIAWLELLPEVLDALDRGRVLVIDEIDTSLHPLLTASLIELFQSEDTNSRGAQLILTTHDSSLLGTVVRPDGLLNRDQVWFVEKDADGTSTLYPLTDYKPRNEHNLERRYLGGSFGAIPKVDFLRLVEAVRHADQA